MSLSIFALEEQVQEEKARLWPEGPLLVISEPQQRAEDTAVPSPCSAGWAGGPQTPPEGPQHRGAGDQG